MKTITIKVTKRDIEQGRKNEAIPPSRKTRPFAMDCPCALAANRAGIEGADFMWYRMCYPGSEAIPLPRKAQQWIKRFDAGKPVKPFMFKLRLP